MEAAAVRSGAGRESQGGVSSRLSILAQVGADNSGTWDCSGRILADACGAQCAELFQGITGIPSVLAFCGGWWMVESDHTIPVAQEMP